MITHALISNPCIRCGKQRKIARIWKENLVTMRGNTVITHTQTVCPDKACQKIVDDGLSVLENKRIKQKEERDRTAEERKLANKRNKKTV